jgi:hypothetical protein
LLELRLYCNIASDCYILFYCWILLLNVQNNNLEPIVQYLPFWYCSLMINHTNLITLQLSFILGLKYLSFANSFMNIEVNRLENTAYPCILAKGNWPAVGVFWSCHIHFLLLLKYIFSKIGFFIKLACFILTWNNVVTYN